MNFLREGIKYEIIVHSRIIGYEQFTEETGWYHVFYEAPDTVHDGVYTESSSRRRYTGFIDPVGREVYQGDILQEDALKRSVVYWNQKEGRWGLKQVSGRSCWFGPDRRRTVIGNIYENPEMMK